MTCFRDLLQETSLPPGETGPLCGAIGQLLTLWKERNYIAHGQYGIILKDGGIAPSWSDIKLSKAKEPTDYLEPKEVTKAHLDQHATDVDAAAKAIHDFRYRRV